MRTQLSKSFLFLSLIILVFSAVVSFGAEEARAPSSARVSTATTTATTDREPSSAKSISACAKASDCKLVDLGCGRPGAVNQDVTVPDSTEGCDAAANFDDASKLFSVDCRDKKCQLVQKSEKSKK